MIYSTRVVKALLDRLALTERALSELLEESNIDELIAFIEWAIHSTSNISTPLLFTMNHNLEIYSWITENPLAITEESDLIKKCVASRTYIIEHPLALGIGIGPSFVKLEKCSSIFSCGYFFCPSDGELKQVFRIYSPRYCSDIVVLPVFDEQLQFISRIDMRHAQFRRANLDELKYPLTLSQLKTLGVPKRGTSIFSQFIQVAKTFGFGILALLSNLLKCRVDTIPKREEFNKALRILVESRHVHHLLASKIEFFIDHLPLAHKLDLCRAFHFWSDIWPVYDQLAIIQLSAVTAPPLIQETGRKRGRQKETVQHLKFSVQDSSLLFQVPRKLIGKTEKEIRASSEFSAFRLFVRIMGFCSRHNPLALMSNLIWEKILSFLGTWKNYTDMVFVDYKQRELHALEKEIFERTNDLGYMGHHMHHSEVTRLHLNLRSVQLKYCQLHLEMRGRKCGKCIPCLSAAAEAAEA
jgi:hypothetical protein